MYAVQKAVIEVLLGHSIVRGTNVDYLRVAVVTIIHMCTTFLWLTK